MMRTDRIVYTRPDGGVAVIIPARSTAEARKDIPADATDIVECDQVDIPRDRTYRNGWVRDASAGQGVVQVSMEKARTIHMDRIREARRRRFAALDADQVRALGAGDHAAVRGVEREKQLLRELPRTFDLSGATTPDELKALWPFELSSASGS